MASELDVLRVIARGHPDRKVTATTNGYSGQISGLTWEEIQVALHVAGTDIAEPISILVRKQLIDSGREYPTLLGKLAGQKAKTYFWITPTGTATLASLEDRKPRPEWLDPDDISTVRDLLAQLGFELTMYGVGAAVLSLQSGYGDAETASYLALATVARDVRERGHDLDDTMRIAVHVRTMLTVLRQFHANGLMSEKFLNNDAQALTKIAIPSPEQKEWIDRILSDEVVAKQRVAEPTSNYEF